MVFVVVLGEVLVEEYPFGHVDVTQSLIGVTGVAGVIKVDLGLLALTVITPYLTALGSLTLVLGATTLKEDVDFIEEDNYADEE